MQTPELNGRYRHRQYGSRIIVVSIVENNVVYVYDPDYPMGNFIDGVCDIDHFFSVFEVVR